MNHKGNSLKRLVFASSLLVAICVTAVAGDQKYDESTPLEEVQKAATGGHSGAMLEYGSRLLQGQGVETNSTEGLDWLQKAAEAGNNQAWYVMGVVYSNGIGVDVDFPKAINYFRKGAELGDADCQTSMGMIYQAGDRIPSGIEANPIEAAKWYRMAADQGHTEAIQHLAMMTTRGMGIEKNDEEGALLFRKGAELGNADCKWGLGQCYLDGKGVEVDSVTAYALFTASLDGIEFPEQKKAMTARRDELGKLLTAEQMKQAEPIAEKWKTQSKE